jgi:hypothetical protein
MLRVIDVPVFMFVSRYDSAPVMICRTKLPSSSRNVIPFSRFTRNSTEIGNEQAPPVGMMKSSPGSGSMIGPFADAEPARTS